MPLIRSRVHFSGPVPDIELVRDSLQQTTGLPVEIQKGDHLTKLVLNTSQDGIHPQEITYRSDQHTVTLICVADLVNKYPNYFLVATASALAGLGGTVDDELPSYAELSWSGWKELHGGKIFPRWKGVLVAALFLWPVWLILAVVLGIVIFLWL